MKFSGIHSVINVIALRIATLLLQDPYVDPECLTRFATEVEKFEKSVESLYKQPMSGPTSLEKEWRVCP